MIVAGERFDRTTAGVAYKPQSRALDPLDIVITQGWNVRDMSSAETREHIDSLKLSITTNGYDETKPISVRYDSVSGVSTLVDGQCRLTACRELRKEGTDIWIPCVVTKGDEAQLTAASLSGNAGKPLTQWEIGEGCRRLSRFGWSIEKIAASICKSKRYVTEAVALSNVSIEAKTMLAAGEVTPGAVLNAVKVNGSDAAASVLKREVSERRAKTPKGEKPEPITRPKKPSAKEEVLKSSPTADLLNQAVILARHVVADDLSFDKLESLAQSFLAAAGVKL